MEPVVTDGRDIDRDIGELLGEGAQQRSRGAHDEHIAEMAERWQALPEASRIDPTYYDRPLLNESVWHWAIPTYYYVGGVTGASLALGAAVQLFADRDLRALVRQCRWIGFAGACISGVLLVADLGRPMRFLNMLRVFRPTSPMNVGAWILSKVGAASSLAAIFDFELAGLSAGLSGLGLATYTGVLVANTAVPVWQESRRVLPILFGSSAMASAGCLLEMVGDQRGFAVARTFRISGQIAEIALAFAMEKQVARIERVARPLRSGFSGFLWRASAVLAASSLLVTVLPIKKRAKKFAAGILGTLGSLALRFAVDKAGLASARDPRASFHLQRAQLNFTNMGA
ncbi:MAG TPA: NrfD/PsrC family molybdoenzyme membrane anchor subunit [Bryobacteraceae bacterium]|nr:NrfD/PsrC family molybdoenzyme membrane anchor subunit [Bryobacteraceae bacterium]